MPTRDGAHFAVAVEPAEDAVVLRLSGELDHDTAGPLRRALDAALSAGPQRLLVDLHSLDFCDSTGINILLHGRREAEEAGGSLELVGLRPPVERLFRITGADRIFTVHADLAQALVRRPSAGP